MNKKELQEMKDYLDKKYGSLPSVDISDPEISQKIAQDIAEETEPLVTEFLRLFGSTSVPDIIL